MSKTIIIPSNQRSNSSHESSNTPRALEDSLDVNHYHLLLPSNTIIGEYTVSSESRRGGKQGPRNE